MVHSGKKRNFVPPSSYEKKQTYPEISPGTWPTDLGCGVWSTIAFIAQQYESGFFFGLLLSFNKVTGKKWLVWLKFQVQSLLLVLVQYRFKLYLIPSRGNYCSACFLVCVSWCFSRNRTYLFHINCFLFRYSHIMIIPLCNSRLLNENLQFLSARQSS